MLKFAEKVGWKIQKRDDDLIHEVCNEIGVDRTVLKVWMHNNKNNFTKRDNNNIINNMMESNNNNEIGVKSFLPLEDEEHKADMNAEIHTHHSHYQNEGGVRANGSSSSS